MKHLRIVLLLLSLFWAACNSNPTASSNETGSSAGSQSAPTPVEFPSNFYMKLRGTIGDGIPITMDLIKDDTLLLGNYYYDKVGLPLSLRGTFRPDNRVQFKEMNEKYEETGAFDGKFTSSTVLEGTWTNPTTKKSLPFKLEKSTAGSAEITFEDFHEEDCKNRERNLQKAKSEDEGWFTDTLCSYIDIRLLKASTGDSNRDRRINESIVNEVTSSYFVDKNRSIESHLKSIHEIGPDEYLSLEQHCGVMMNDHDILSLDVWGYEFSGGAHPNSWVSYLNLDLRTGKKLALEDLFSPHFENELNAVGERIFFGEGGDAGDGGWEFDGDKFQLNDNFAITTGGLLFTFNPYEIGPYAAGSPQVFIPYKDVKQLIRKDGPLARIVGG